MTEKVVNNGPSYQHRAEKKSGRKRENPPCTPYKRKARGKENSAGDGDINMSPRPRARACVRTRERFDAHGNADPVPQLVDEAVRFCNASNEDRLIWLKICNRNPNSFLGVLMEFECDVEQHPECRLKSPAAAFQARLNRALPKGGAK